jgi:hypothetical protein
MSGISRNYPDGSGKIQRFSYGEHEEDTITMRNPQSALLLIDSQDRYKINKDGVYEAEQELNPNNIYINHQKLNGFGEIKRAGVTDVYFPWRTPNINIKNNTFGLSLEVSAGVYNTYFITVPEGFYKPSELARAMQSIMNGATGFQLFPVTAPPTYLSGGGDWTVTTSPSTNAFTIANPTIAFSEPSNAYNQTVQSTIDQVINFTPPTLDVDNVNTFTGGIPSMAYTQYIDFVSDNLTKHQRLKDNLTQFNYTNIIYRLYLSSGAFQAPLTDDTYFGSRPADIYRQVSVPKFMQWNKNEMISAIDIKLYDDAGELLYIPQENWDANYLLTMLLSET